MLRRYNVDTIINIMLVSLRAGEVLPVPMQDCVIEFHRPQRTAFSVCVGNKFRKLKDRKLLNPVKCQIFQRSRSTSQVNITSGRTLAINIFLNNIHTLLNLNILNRDKHPGFLCITPPKLYQL